jgi:hypothetical protein
MKPHFFDGINLIPFIYPNTENLSSIFSLLVYSLMSPINKVDMDSSSGGFGILKT